MPFLERRIMNIAAWKRLGNSDRVVQLVSASHLRTSEVRATMFIIGRLNMLLKNDKRIYVPETTHDNNIALGAALYECLKRVDEMANEYQCAIHIYKHVVYAANQNIVLHLASVDRTHKSK
jgi:hypothetical protein